MVKPRWPVFAALLLLAALLAGAASAQTPETWDANNNLVVDVPGGITGSSTKCASWTDGDPLVLKVNNTIAKVTKVCGRHYGPSGTSSHRYGATIILTFTDDTDTDLVSAWPRGTARWSLQVGGMMAAASRGSFFGSWSNSSTGNPGCSTNCSGYSTWNGAAAGALTKLSINMPDDWDVYAPADVDLEAPARVIADRSADYGQVTLTWRYYDATREYEIERQTAVAVAVGDSTRIEYGNTKLVTLEPGIAGIDSYTDTVEPLLTYHYRLRARGRTATSYSAWSSYAFSGEKPSLDLDAPANVEVSRTHENSQVTVSWTAPEGDFDNYTLQRQELVIVEGSTIFANAVTLDGADWLPGNATTYTDDSFLPGRTYEYRVAAVKDDLIGDYSDWSRSSPVQTSLGVAPKNFRFVSGNGSRLLDRRREFWMRWDEVDGADDYEVGVLVYDVATGGQAIENYIVTDPTYFRTSYGRVEVRVRGRKSDDTLCGDSDGTVETGEDCYSEWTGWYGVNFTPKVTVAAPPLVDDTADASIMELRADTEEVIESSLAAAGAPVDAGLVVQFLTLVAATVIGGVSVALGWRLGMAPLGVGMGAAIAILILFTGYRLFGVPLAWPVSIQAALAVAGLFAAVRQTGVFR